MDYLCERSHRLHTGYSDSPYWATRQLLDAVTPYCSEDRLEKLQQIILNYYPEWEKSKEGMRARGHAKSLLCR